MTTLLFLLSTLTMPGTDAFAQDAWRKAVEAHRERRIASLRNDPFSPLALVHREYLDGRTLLTVGSEASADVRLAGAGIAGRHARLQVTSGKPRVYAEGAVAMVRSASGPAQAPLQFTTQSQTLELAPGTGLRVGRYNLLYRAEAPVRGAAVEVYDTAEPALREFRGLEFFEMDARYRVQAEMVPRAEPPQVQLVDSAGQPRPYYIYGDLRFTLDGAPLTMEVYSTTLDRAAIERGGFMLIFADATSGKESYYAGRYLDIEGKLSGTVTVDFNLARNPPCAFSPVYTCPLPRAQNRLPVPIRAGEKTFAGKAATPLQAGPAK